jgi:Domain of unknown function (DUF4347)
MTLFPALDQSSNFQISEPKSVLDITSPSTVSRSLLFIDSGVADAQTLLNGASGVEVHLLRSGQDAVAQITQTLLGRSGIESLQIVSHGRSGALQLGETWLDRQSLPGYVGALKSWGAALSEDADILLYGCNVAQNAAGQSFVNLLAQATGADVAASDDLTGSAALGGDWDLEYATGAIEAALATQSYNGVLVSPVIALPGATIAYLENAAATVIDPTATVSDLDSANFNTGKLTVRFSANGTSDDRLSIRNEGAGATQINLDGREIYYGSNKIGSFTGGIGTANLVVTFNAAATPNIAQALVRNISYANVSQTPSVLDRTVEFVVTDGSGGISTAVTKTIKVTSDIDGAISGSTTVLYDGTTGKTPDQTGAAPGGPWFFYQDTKLLTGGTVTKTVVTNGSKLDSDNGIYAGYTNYSPNLTNPTAPKLDVNPNFPVLDRTQGYTFNFKVQLNSETTRTAGANKDGEGLDDRAGFSVILLSSDKKGIELGFWSDRIWAQEDGTTQKDPSLEPTNSNPFRTFFTQAEGAAFNTTVATDYNLTIVGDTYTLSSVGGSTILSGKLRDYSAFKPQVLPPVTPPNPYNLANFVFLGDNTPQAGAAFTLERAAIVRNTNPQVPQADVLLRNPGSGDVRILGLSQNQIAASELIKALDGTVVSPGADWKLVTGKSDLNGDGIRDLVWFNSGSGESAVWYMQKGNTGLSNIIGSASLVYLPNAQKSLQVAPGWQLTAVENLLGDSRPEFLWEERGTGSTAIWQLDIASNGRTDINLAGSAFVTLNGATIQTGGIASGWKIAGLGNFTVNSSTKDILWFNEKTTETAVWQLDGTAIVGSGFVNSLGKPLTPVGWRPVAVANLDGVGLDEIVWQSGTTVAVWNLGSNYEVTNRSVILSQSLVAGEQVQALADLNLDGSLDLVVRQKASDVGGISIYYLNKATFQLAIPTQFLVEPPATTAYSVGDRRFDIIDAVDLGGPLVTLNLG